MAQKRGPSVLVTDARERPLSRGAARRPGSSSAAASGLQRPSMRHVSVDSILQHATEIPSGQPRVPAGPLRAMPSSGLLAAATARRRVSGGPVLRTTSVPSTPSRTTKISEKLVLLPETGGDDKEDDEEDDEEDDDDDVRRRIEEGGGLYDGARPPRDEELDVLRKRGGIRGKSYAERLSKGQRAEKVARLTAYCTAQAFKMRATADFLRTHHAAKAKLYDDCLYTVYHLPLLPGLDGYRVRSRPILKTPGTGKTVLDLEIERSERRDEHVGYGYEEQQEQQQGPAPINRLVSDAKHFAELFVFAYGVVVFWNFSEQQEKAILADLSFAESEQNTAALAVRPLDEADFETEEFHFEYNERARRPRVFNDMITLLPRSDHMVKLTISHAIAQSTKLCFFEEQMSETLQDAQHVPKQLALTGELDMSRTEIVRILGLLFKNRVEINLSSNILDVPNFFWDAEPTLHPLYVAIREYLEIDPRIQVLNERCRVFLDLAEILADSVADAKMSYITWICIILIVISICVTVTEVLVRFGILERERRRVALPPNSSLPWLDAASAPALQLAPHSLDELRAWGAGLDSQELAAVCGSEFIGQTFAGV